MNLSNRVNVTYHTAETLSKQFQSAMFVRHEPLRAEADCSLYEVVKRKKVIHDEIPVSGAFFILSNAKLHVLRYIQMLRANLNTRAMRILYMV